MGDSGAHATAAEDTDFVRNSHFFPISISLRTVRLLLLLEIAGGICEVASVFPVGARHL